MVRKKWLWCTLIVAPPLALILAVAAAEDPPDPVEYDRSESEYCAGCHLEAARDMQQWVVETWSGSAHANSFTPGHNDNTYCAKCHSPFEADPLATQDTHEDIPSVNHPELPQAITCGACHPPHELREEWGTPIGNYDITTQQWSPVHEGDENDLCEYCHSGTRHGVHIMSAMGAVRCIDCHMPKMPVTRTYDDGHTDIRMTRTHMFDFDLDDAALAEKARYACVGCHSDRGTDWAVAVIGSGMIHEVPENPDHPGYAGDASCRGCHSDYYDNYIQSGHPYKLTLTAGQEPAPDTWPHTPPPPLPPDGLTWDNVEYVIGNFYWKARFVEADGFIHTGDEVQWNLATQEFVGYHPGEKHPYNCGKCHTTGYDPEGHQDGLPGIVGTWAQPGVRCEACHGPSAEHVASQLFGAGDIFPEGGKDCSECHYRDAEFRMPWKGGFMRHHQQAEDFSHSPHDSLGCGACHDAHKSVVYDLGGTIAECSDCHAGDEANNNYAVAGMEHLECIDCHMPKMGKSAVKTNDYAADVRGHLFRIMTDPVAAADNTYQVGDTTFWNQEPNGDAEITLDYACLGCHTEFDPGFTLADAAAYAKGIHSRQPGADTWVVDVPFMGDRFTVTFEEFGGFLLVETMQTDGQSVLSLGMELNGVIFWMDTEGTIFFGNLNRGAGTAAGLVFDYAGGSTLWFAEQL